MLQFCTMAMVHCNNAVRVPMPIIHPENWLLVVKNSRLFAQRAHSTRCAPQKQKEMPKIRFYCGFNVVALQSCHLNLGFSVIPIPFDKICNSIASVRT